MTKSVLKNHIIRLSLFIAMIIVFNSFQSSAQELKRKVSLGIRMQPINDSIADANKVPKGVGIYIPQVLPNTTASEAGLKDGVILTQINGSEINTFPQLHTSIANLQQGDEIKFTYYKNSKLISKSSIAKGRKKEQSDIANIYYEQVEYDGNRLRSILYTPKNSTNPPVVFYLQGYTCGSVELPPNHPIKKLINDWVNDGYAVFRVEKPSIGDSKCDKGCYEIDFNEEVTAFRHAYKNLQNNKRIDTNRIFLFGHSMGGIIAPIVAKEFNPKGVITYGTAVKSWFEYIQELTREQGEMFNTPFAEIDRDLRKSLPFWYKLYVVPLRKHLII